MQPDSAVFSILFNCVISLLLSTSGTSAQPATYAVVIGISDYEAFSYRTGDLRFADRDARQVAAFLQSPLGGRVPASNMRVLTNRQATASAIGQAMLLFRKAKPTDRIMLYFSGHGTADSFAPADARSVNDLKRLSHQTIKAAFRASKASTKLCIADACLSGGMTNPTAVASTFGQSAAPHADESGAIALLLASRSTQVAIESRQLAGGTFTHYLLRGLSGRADRNADRIVTIRELHQYVSQRVKQATNGKQTPIFYGRFPDNLPLTYI
ncbi:caspase family protein [Spirosoma montaniterrae]|uniref:Peptidase C14 n=1 Tax=Spirosoma montaniterrae TaxID=1178516 RepID=A0A1P9X3E2_9BACT|nr:caspase family protein [Spirosoma montaniterrae]AQG82156.1 peptidase C14 [Spirosoma montaniterrae]